MTEQTKNTAATATAAPAPGKLPAGFTVAKNVTLPLNKWKNDEPKFLRIDGGIFQGKEVKGASGKQADMEPAMLANCTDLLTGEECQIIVATVLKGILEEEYPDEKYVGKMFSITQHRDSGKKYNTYSVAELQQK